MMLGQKTTSKTRDPAIWLANVDVKKVMKKADKDFGLLSELRFLVAVDCKGERRIRKPTI